MTLITSWMLVFLLSTTWIPGPWRFEDKKTCEEAAKIWINGFLDLGITIQDYKCIEQTNIQWN